MHQQKVIIEAADFPYGFSNPSSAKESMQVLEKLATAQGGYPQINAFQSLHTKVI